MSASRIGLLFGSFIAACGLGAPASAQSTSVGALNCDVSAGVGLILVQKQSLNCIFTPSNGGPPDRYSGSIAEYGVALGAVQAGHLIWGVFAPTAGLPKGALAGDYGGVGAQATAVVGVGANALLGGTGRSFTLQPVSVEGQVGLNVAAGITSVTLKAMP